MATWRLVGEEEIVGRSGVSRARLEVFIAAHKGGCHTSWWQAKV